MLYKTYKAERVNLRALVFIFMNNMVISWIIIIATLSSSVQVDRLEDELISEQEKFKAINEELEQTFAEMSGY